eukprot:1149988-Pelagomonas_calceolata.AAC.1
MLTKLAQHLSFAHLLFSLHHNFLQTKRMGTSYTGTGCSWVPTLPAFSPGHKPGWLHSCTRHEAAGSDRRGPGRGIVPQVHQERAAQLGMTWGVHCLTSWTVRGGRHEKASGGRKHGEVLAFLQCFMKRAEDRWQALWPV